MPADSRRADFVSAISHAGQFFIAVAFDWPQQLSLFPGDLTLAANQNGIVPRSAYFIVAIAPRRKVVCRIRTAAQLDREHRIAVANADVIKIQVGVIRSQRTIFESQEVW